MQAWQTHILAQAGISLHRVSQQSPRMGILTSRALLLKPPKASAKVSRKFQNILRIPPYDKRQFNRYPSNRVFEMPHVGHVPLSGCPGYSPTREETALHPGFNTLATG